MGRDLLLRIQGPYKTQAKRACARPFHFHSFVPALSTWNIDAGLLLETLFDYIPFLLQLSKGKPPAWLWGSLGGQTVETLWPP